METAFLAHKIGLVGEALNFLGAFILAFDLFQRPSERRHTKRLRELRDFGQKFALKRTRYGGVGICSNDFDNIISDRHTTRLGFIGVVIMALGFLCLMAYHLLEINA